MNFIWTMLLVVAFAYGLIVGDQHQYQRMQQIAVSNHVAYYDTDRRTGQPVFKYGCEEVEEAEVTVLPEENVK